jgi:hypothetical protein
LDVINNGTGYKSNATKDKIDNWVYRVHDVHQGPAAATAVTFGESKYGQAVAENILRVSTAALVVPVFAVELVLVACINGPHVQRF